MGNSPQHLLKTDHPGSVYDTSCNVKHHGPHLRLCSILLLTRTFPISDFAAS